MFFDRFSKSFFSFVKKEKTLSSHEKKEIFSHFQNKNIRVIMSVSLYLIIWSFVVAFIDASLFTRGTIRSFLHFSIFGSFLPSLIFIFINALIKYGFIYFYTKRKKIKTTRKHILIGIIPIVGSLFFTAYLLKGEPFLISIVLKYLKYIRKKLRWLKILKNKDIN